MPSRFRGNAYGVGFVLTAVGTLDRFLTLTTITGLFTADGTASAGRALAAEDPVPVIETITTGHAARCLAVNAAGVVRDSPASLGRAPSASAGAA